MPSQFNIFDLSVLLLMLLFWIHSLTHSPARAANQLAAMRPPRPFAAAHDARSGAVRRLRLTRDCPHDPCRMWWPDGAN